MIKKDEGTKITKITLKYKVMRNKKETNNTQLGTTKWVSFVILKNFIGQLWSTGSQGGEDTWRMCLTQLAAHTRDYTITEE